MILENTELITFFDDDQVENAEVGVNDATTDRLALTLTSPAGAVAGVALAEQQAHTSLGQDTLLHGEALLVIASADAHHVALAGREPVQIVGTLLTIPTVGKKDCIRLNILNVGTRRQNEVRFRQMNLHDCPHIF